MKEKRMAVVIGILGAAVLVSISGCAKQPAAETKPVDAAVSVKAVETNAVVEKATEVDTSKPEAPVAPAAEK